MAWLNEKKMTVSNISNESQNWNGTLDAYCHVTPVEQNENEKQKNTVCGLGITKEVGGIQVLLTHSLFASDILRR